MNTKTVVSNIALLLGIGALLTFGYAVAATKGDPSPAMKYGAVNVLNSAATAIPNMAQANTVLVQNLGPNVIYCGSDNTVTTSTGIQVPASGGVMAIDIVQVPPAYGSTNVTPVLYCIAATADQTSPSNTRYMRVK